MTKLNQLFQSLPEKFQELLTYISESCSLQIEPIEKLSGGKSGAILFYASIQKTNATEKKHCILKLDYATKWENEANEVQRHTDAQALSSPQFVAKHLTEFTYEPIEFQDTIAIFYTVAGNSLQHFRPINLYSKQKQLESIFRTVGYDLLSEWQKDIKFELTAPQKILEEWLGYRIKAEEGNIESFLADFCYISNDVQAILYEDKRIPNPLFYAQNLSAWADVRQLQTAKGLVHGDLHTQNILAKMQINGELNDYYLIDFANFKSNEFLFYDHLYLELSYLLNQYEYNSPSDWNELILTISENNIPDIQNVSAKLSGVCALINASRTSLRLWIDSHHGDKSDDLWGQFRLAAVAVGLNFSNKIGLDNEKRFSAFIYAALNLNQFCKQFNISIQGNAKEISIQKTKENVEIPNDWEGFFDACHEFSNERLYILITGPQRTKDSSLSNFGLIPWSLVFDFDESSDIDGLYKSVIEELEKRRAVHLLTLRDNYTLNPKRATYWYASNGLKGRTDTIPNGKDFRQWNRKYSLQLQKFLADFNAADELPVTVLIIWDESEFIEEIIKLIDLTVADKAEYVFAITDKEKLKRAEDSYKAKSFQLDGRQIGFGIKKFFNSALVPSKKVYLPTNSDLPVELMPDVVTWLEEEMTLVHLDCGIFAESDRAVGKDFLRGKRISWFELGMHFDVGRSKTLIIENQVKSDLEERLSTRINLYHFPGAGGSTVALRIAWNLHKEFPTILLHEVTNQTRLRLTKINRETGKPILVIVESSEIQSEIFSKFYSELQSENMPIVFLIITRRFGFLQDSNRSFYLSEKLDQEEANRFVQIYGQHETKNLHKLKKLAKDISLFNQRTPFYFGLTAFEENFIMLETYVSYYLTQVASYWMNALSI